MDKNKKEMTKSHFNMWRLVVSAVHADERIDVEETKMVESYLTELDFNEEQLNILKEELQNPANMDEILPEITDPGDRSQSVYFVRLLFWKDKILTSSEEDFLKKVQGYFAQFLNMDKVKVELLKFQEISDNQDAVASLPDTPSFKTLEKDIQIILRIIQHINFYKNLNICSFFC